MWFKYGLKAQKLAYETSVKLPFYLVYPGFWWSFLFKLSTA